MTSIIQNNIISLTIGIVALVLSAYATYALYKLQSLKAMFFAGPKGEELEPRLHAIMDDIQHLQNQQTTAHEYMAQIRQQLGFAVQRVGMVRYNPFDEGGGNFSFSIALLNEHHTGVVISSLYGRQQNRMYAKNITQGKSEMTLTEEEQQALKEAIG